MQAQPTSRARRILVAYFSWSGNTREIANQIHKIVGGDLFEIVTVDKYPRDYDETVKQARKELETNCRPRLASEVEDIESYDLVFIGYPNWCYTIPAPVASSLSKCDSTEKTIAPFCTHGGDRLGESVKDISNLCQHSLVLEGLAVRGSEVRNAQNKVSEWLRKIRVAE
ncbi:MAG: flavodoxin [Methanobacteriota archaeon]|nr:MAG: flavodoxin [Euryarchaeota archaeon]